MSAGRVIRPATPILKGRRQVRLQSNLRTLAASAFALAAATLGPAHAQEAPKPAAGKPNILVIFGDDIGQSNISAYSMGLMGYHTPNIDPIAKEGMLFTDYYAENSCAAAPDC